MAVAVASTTKLMRGVVCGASQLFDWPRRRYLTSKVTFEIGMSKSMGMGMGMGMGAWVLERRERLRSTLSVGACHCHRFGHASGRPP